MKLIKQKGEGFVETLITLLIIAFGVIALVKFQNSIAYADDVARQRSDAILLGMNRIEVLRDYSSLAAYTNIATTTTTASSGYNTTYTITSTVTTTASPLYKTLNVSVTWTDRYGTSNTVQLVTNLAGLDPAQSAAVM